MRKVRETKVIAYLVDGIMGELIGFNNCFMNHGGWQSGEATSGMEHYLHQTDHAGIMDFDTGDTGIEMGKGQSQTLQERKIKVDVEHWRLERSKAVNDRLRGIPNRGEIFEGFFQA